MQSEGGAAGAIHGATSDRRAQHDLHGVAGFAPDDPQSLQDRRRTTPTVFHIAARSLAAQALSIFGDHSDVMAARATGWAMLCSASVQEAQDLALIAHAASLEARIPFLHFFDGFRTSHEISKIALLPEDVLREMINEVRVIEHRARALSPDHPVIRGTAQNPDVYFQARETVNPFYAACPDIVQKAMDDFATLTGRRYELFQYHGAPDAERVIVMMGSGCEATHETVDFLQRQNEKVGLLKVRLYRPFDADCFIAALPKTTAAIAVLDRTKEPGAGGEPLYLDCINALYEHGRGAVRAIGGRYGLSSKEFTPAMVKAVFDQLAQPAPKNHFTIGIDDDLSHTSLAFDPGFSIEAHDVVRAQFFGLGSDGTVGANKESIKIIGENTAHFAQGYFVYDSKKAGATTISHLRFGPRPIRSTYLVTSANFIGCHQPFLLETFDVLKDLAPRGTVLLNSPSGRERVWDHLPENSQRRMIEQHARLFVIDANKVARDSGMGGRINTVMQTCFFAISGVLPPEEALAAIKNSIRKTYGKKGEEIVAKNLRAVDETITHLYEVEVPREVAPRPAKPDGKLDAAPHFVRNVLGEIMAGRGERVPVSALPNDGTFPTSTTQWEKRNLAVEVPVWDPEVCIQCGKCVMVCPHAVIRSKVYEPPRLDRCAEDLQVARSPAPRMERPQLHPPGRGRGLHRLRHLCRHLPGEKQIGGAAQGDQHAATASAPRNRARELEFLPSPSRSWTAPKYRSGSVRGMQVQQPLFEFSGACAGCGETPYIKLLTQLFGDRLIIANATGCSSIYGGNLPSTPYAKNSEGRGPGLGEFPL
jgi:pyruvate-ferredoxin/flavodoxin oxidoreductase